MHERKRKKTNRKNNRKERKRGWRRSVQTAEWTMLTIFFAKLLQLSRSDILTKMIYSGSIWRRLVHIIPCSCTTVRRQWICKSSYLKLTQASQFSWANYPCQCQAWIIHEPATLQFCSFLLSWISLKFPIFTLRISFFSVFLSHEKARK